MFRSSGHDVHVHGWRDSDPEISRYLKFRDRLRASPEDCRAYEQLKRDLATRPRDPMNQYADAKSLLIEDILARAVD